MDLIDLWYGFLFAAGIASGIFVVQFVRGRLAKKDAEKRAERTRKKHLVLGQGYEVGLKPQNAVPSEETLERMRKMWGVEARSKNAAQMTSPSRDDLAMRMAQQRSVNAAHFGTDAYDSAYNTARQYNNTTAQSFDDLQQSALFAAAAALLVNSNKLEEHRQQKAADDSYPATQVDDVSSRDVEAPSRDVEAPSRDVEAPSRTIEISDSTRGMTDSTDFTPSSIPDSTSSMTDSTSSFSDSSSSSFSDSSSSSFSDSSSSSFSDSSSSF